MYFFVDDLSTVWLLKFGECLIIPILFLPTVLLGNDSSFSWASNSFSRPFWTLVQVSLSLSFSFCAHLLTIYVGYISTITTFCLCLAYYMFILEYLIDYPELSYLYSWYSIIEPFSLLTIITYSKKTLYL